jgi:phosphoserine phosphatase
MIIATLIAADRLGESDISTAAAALADAGLRVTERRWIDTGSACDLFAEGPHALARPALETALRGVDVVVHRGARRPVRLLVADMDSTMITVECIDELADYAGLKAQVAAVTEQAMRGELDFEAALDARVALLAGMDASFIDRCREERVEISPGAATLVRTMRGRGATCLLVSGGFTHFAEPIAKEIGFDRVLANELVIEGGRLTGAVRRPIVDAQAKRGVLVNTARELGIGLAEVMAVGDGANDIPMIEEAGLGMAYRAKPAVRNAADAALEHSSLAALLYAQDIPRSQWVTG